MLGPTSKLIMTMTLHHGILSKVPKSTRPILQSQRLPGDCLCISQAYICSKTLCNRNTGGMTSKQCVSFSSHSVSIQRSTRILQTVVWNSHKLIAVYKSLYPRPLDVPNLKRPQEAHDFVKSLKEKERKNLFIELQKLKVGSDTANPIGDPKEEIAVSRSELRILFFFNCIPFIGFGFLDNAIMILAGDYVDHTIGLTLGISTMAAAALGNLISDIAGIGLAGYVELLCSKLGLPVPDLSLDQLNLTKSRFYSNFGKAFGIFIGCLLGMFPLLFLHDKRKDSE